MTSDLAPNPESNFRPSPSRSTPARDAMIAAGLVGIVFLLYAQVYSHQFIDFDDTSYVTNNPAVSSGLNIRSITWAFTSFHDGYWLPITWLSYMAVEQASPHNAGLHLLVNVIFHAANAVLLWMALRRLTGRDAPSLAVAILFAVHPQHVESVAWVAERKDVLFLFFGLLSLCTYEMWARPSRPVGAAGPDVSASSKGGFRAALALVASVGFYALSLMCKPMLVTLPLVLNLLDYWPLERLRRQGSQGSRASGIWSALGPIAALQVEKIPFYALALASAFISVLGKKISGATQTTADFPVQVRIANALLSYAKYLWHTIAGFHELAIFYPYPRPGEITIGLVLGAFGILVAISAACVRSARSRPYLVVGWLWFLVSLLPVIGLVQVGAQAMADRFVYFSAIGLYVGVVWLLFDLADKSTPRARRMTIGAGVALVIAMCAFSFVQIGYWRDSGTVFQRAVDVTRNNDLAEEDLGVYLAQHGDIDAALRHFLRAAEISPNFASAHHNAGMAYEFKGDFKSAFAQYQAASRADPQFVDSYFNAGNLFLRLGRPAQARECYLQVLRINPHFAPAIAAIEAMEKR